MSGCLPVWTSDNSGIFPRWLGEDVTPVFAEAGLPCIEFSVAAKNLAFTSEENIVLFSYSHITIEFDQTCR